MRDHVAVEELLAVEALGGLDRDDRGTLDALLAEHGPDCAECAALREEFAETAAMLGTGLGETPVSEGLEEQTVRLALADRRGDASPAPKPSRGGRWLVAVAAAIVLLAVGAAAGYLAAPPSTEDAFGAFVNQRGTNVVQMEPVEGQQGSVTLAVGADGTEGFIAASDLPALPDGKVYELWTIAGDTPTSVGCLAPEGGQATQPITGSFGSADVAAITVEDAACPDAPTTAPVLAAELR